MRGNRNRNAYPRGGRSAAGIGGLMRSRWWTTTGLALLAVAVIFVDALLTVEVQRVSLERHHLNRDMATVRTELDALESQCASISSHMELGEKAAKLGLRVPSREQVVMLPASFLEAGPSVGPLSPEELRYGFTKNWIKLLAAGTP